jgi:ketosteroid isomerase-like protein
VGSEVLNIGFQRVDSAVSGNQRKRCAETDESYGDHAPDAIEQRGDLAYAYGSFSCIDRGRPVAMRFLMVLRKESDGNWRVQRESSWMRFLPTPVD